MRTWLSLMQLDAGRLQSPDGWRADEIEACAAALQEIGAAWANTAVGEALTLAWRS